ncbi:ABC transporter ATP-binding protein [Staphylococcus cohnii]|uniref:ABC transporter ATP-binding protein n=1 Tax=Staphylococcus ureilyticus TaxID=94138 RepID=UPI000D1C5810|nr:ABC transporter ATP-binding protein [Staphylococcus ureilyticus]MBM9448528.1 ABC transporter ATP-binding protein [Staphylococcus ureilyticus]PTF44896.1 ABC transporter ATP-binding protein [Staphylococcus cohnii]
MNTILSLSNVSKSHKKSNFKIDDITFSIQPNKIIGFIGKNGAGKSTTIKTILGGLKKDSGQINFLDKNIETTFPYSKEEIGVVFDDLKIPHELNAEKINSVFKNIYSNWNEKDYFSYIEQFNLPLKRNVGDFSRGMSMKISLTIALSHNPKLLILDEATAGLDPAGREEMLEILEDFANRNDNSILMSSHITSDIENLATDLIFIKDGKIILNSEKTEFINQYTVIKGDRTLLDNVKEEDIIAVKQSKDYFEVVIKNKYNYKSINSNSNVSIDDISKVLMRGDLK